MVQADTRKSVEDIRKELLQLPYYSVFDFLPFSYDRGTVVVDGYVYALGYRDPFLARYAPGGAPIVGTDLGMPVEDGFSLIRDVRERLAPDVPAIALSAYADQRSRERRWPLDSPRSWRSPRARTRYWNSSEPC
jgi:hypothetical protein